MTKRKYIYASIARKKKKHQQTRNNYIDYNSFIFKQNGEQTDGEIIKSNQHTKKTTGGTNRRRDKPREPSDQTR